MTPYVVSPRAQADLDAIWDYVAEHNPSAADRLLNTFYEEFLLLAGHPFLGQVRDELRPGIRSFVVLRRPHRTEVRRDHGDHR